MFTGLKVYIAGPITGTDDYKERFAAAEIYLRELGALPMHSAYLPQGYSHAEYLYICRAMIDVCEAVFFMDGWSKNEGSKREFCYAALKNKRMLYEEIDPAWKFDNAAETATPIVEAMEQLESGKKTINQLREEYGLKRIDEEWADERMLKRE